MVGLQSFARLKPRSDHPITRSPDHPIPPGCNQRNYTPGACGRGGNVLKTRVLRWKSHFKTRLRLMRSNCRLRNSCNIFDEAPFAVAGARAGLSDWVSIWRTSPGEGGYWDRVSDHPNHNVFDLQRQLSGNGRMGNKDDLEDLPGPRAAARAASPDYSHPFIS